MARELANSPNTSKAVVGRPKLNLPPYEDEGEDLAAKWYGILWDGTETTEEEIDAITNEWEHDDAHAPGRYR